MLIIMYEASAELCYPVSEVISLAFISTIQNCIRFLLRLIMDAVPYDGNLPSKSLMYTYMALFFIMIIAALWLIRKSEFI